MQDKQSESYEKIIEYEKAIHEKNQNRIKVGIRLVVIIPLIFLFVMFKLESSKVVFLVLWIASLFGISIYLIGVEYMDYQLQRKLSELGIREEETIKGLLKEESRVEDFIVNAGLLEEKYPKCIPEIAKAEETENASETVIVDVLETLPKAEEGSALENAQEEMVQSIRKYVEALAAQTVQEGMPDKKTPQDYAAMRKARALEKHEKEQAKKK